MTEPVWVADIFGIKFVIDTSDFTLITLDGFDVDMAANAETSMEVNSVDYQVASGKIFRLLGVQESMSEVTNPILTQTDTADSQVGTIDKWEPPFTTESTIGNGKGPTTIFDVTFAAGKFLTVHNRGAASRVFTANGLIGLEYTVV